MRLERVSDKPLLTPRPDVQWEQHAVFNTAVADTGSEIHLLYRAVYHPGWTFGAHGAQYDSSIGHAVSKDGIHFERFDEPVLGHGVTKDGIELIDPQDPRVTQIGDTFYMMYCEWDQRSTQICLAESKNLHDWTPRGVVVPFEQFGMNKNAALFPEKINGRYCMIHRPEPKEGLDRSPYDFDWDLWTRDPQHWGGMRLSFSDDLLNWTYEPTFMMPREGLWDEMKVGVAGPPMRTEAGWLLVYHGVNKQRHYRLGIALLDLNDPSKVLKRQTEPIIEPELPWEIEGDVPMVIFSCGNTLRGNELWVYYAGADTVISLAKADITDFING